MANLNNLTVAYLNKLAKECRITLKKGNKAEIIKQIKNAGISNDKLEKLAKKYLEKYQEEKKQPKKKKDTGVSVESKLEQRVKQLEEQIKFLMSKINTIEIQLVKGRKSISINETNSIEEVKYKIKSLILPGESITIDELLNIKELQELSLDLLKNAITDLIDDEIFDGSEGSSNKKIEGNIGRLIRR